jgi:hypothetical protein
MCKRVMAISSWLIIIMFWAMFSPQFVPTMPTIGFNVDGAKQAGVTFSMWDLGRRRIGRKRERERDHVDCLATLSSRVLDG